MDKLKPCFCCGSEQVQYCSDSNNPSKDIAKCRNCKAQAPVKAWNRRPTPIAEQAVSVPVEALKVSLESPHGKPWYDARDILHKAIAAHKEGV